MPDLRLNWGDIPGGYGTELTGAATIETGGVAVTVASTNENPTATAFALNLDTFDDPGDDLPPSSQLKLIGDGGPAGDTVSIAGPVARVEIDYGNNSTGEQEILVSDLLFTTTDPAPNEAPDAVDDVAATPVDTLLEDIPVLANDSDPNGDPLTVTSATAPNGTVTINPDGTLNYQPDPGFTGTDTITYTVTDPDGATDTADVIVTVSDDPNEAPVAVDDTATTAPGTLLEDIPVLANDSDPDGDPLTVTEATAPNGTLTFWAMTAIRTATRSPLFLPLRQMAQRWSTPTARWNIFLRMTSSAKTPSPTPLMTASPAPIRRR